MRLIAHKSIERRNRRFPTHLILYYYTRILFYYRYSFNMIWLWYTCSGVATYLLSKSSNLSLKRVYDCTAVSGKTANDFKQLLYVRPSIWSVCVCVRVSVCVWQVANNGKQHEWFIAATKREEKEAATTTTTAGAAATTEAAAAAGQEQQS